MFKDTTFDNSYEYNGNRLRCLEIPELKPTEHKICDYHSFFRNHLNQNNTLNKNFTRVDDYLNNISEYLLNTYSNKIDPVQYLHYLYYTEGLSYQEIYQRTKDLTDYKSSESIIDIFTKRFWWKSRDANERTEISSRKRESSKNMDWVKDYIAETRKTTKLDFDRIITQRWLKESDDQKIDENEIESFKFEYERLFYFMNVMYNTNKELSVIIIKELFNNWIRARALTLIFQEKIDKLLEKSDISFTLSKNHFNYVNSNFKSKKTTLD